MSISLAKVTRRMKPKIKAIWLEALRNPILKQGRYCLREGNTFCCNGLLVELFRKSKANVDKLDWELEGFLSKSYRFAGSLVTIPLPVLQWSGLQSGFLWIEYKGRFMRLDQVNRLGVSYAELADLIEAQF